MFTTFSRLYELKAECWSSSLFTGNGKGGFTRNDRWECRLAPTCFHFSHFTRRAAKCRTDSGNFMQGHRNEGRFWCAPANQPAIEAGNHTCVASDVMPVEGEVVTENGFQTGGGKRSLIVAGTMRLLFCKRRSEVSRNVCYMRKLTLGTRRVLMSVYGCSSRQNLTRMFSATWYCMP